MPTLFVANTSKQTQIFMYQLSESGGSRSETIPIGQQRQIAGDMTSDQIDRIVNHHARYGMKRASFIDHKRDFSGLCYEIDKPVPLAAFYDTYAANDEALDRRGEELREQSAAAINEGIATVLNRPVQRTEVELVDQSDKPSIAAGVEVVREGVAPRHEADSSTRRRFRK